MIKWLYIGAWNERRIYVWKKVAYNDAIKILKEAGEQE